MKKWIVLPLLLICLATSVSAYNSKLEEKLFYSLGHFGAAFLYQTYMTIGMTSDAWTENRYTPDNAKAILQTCQGFLSSTEKLYNELIDFAIPADDRQTLLDMKGIARDLGQEADAMEKYIQHRNQATLDQYESARKRAWEKIAKLMDIK
jgi:hypothetical protein